MTSLRFPLIALLIIIGLSLGGCTHLPDVSSLAAQSPSDNLPAILTEKGLLPPDKSKMLLRQLERKADSGDLLTRYEATLEAVSDLPLTKGNKVTLLVDGKSTYDAMFAAIEGARETINTENYKIEDDEMGQRFTHLLLKKQSQGVQVNLIYDKVGSFATPASFFDNLRSAGVRVVEVNPLNPLGSGAKHPGPHADHRKLLVVDGRVAITGGVNISRVYASTPFRSGQRGTSNLPWRDTDIRIEGPAVAQFQRLFLDTWQHLGGSRLQGAGYFPRLDRQGPALVRAVGSAPGESNRITYISYLVALSFAQHSIDLSSAYFIPDRRTIETLTAAARRGVKVRLLLPSISDSSWALYAMHYNYTEFLKAGLHLYERRKALLHTKTAVVDGIWCTVGSANIDFLSFSQNYEVGAVILSAEFGAEMEKMFEKDLAESREVTLEQWQKRSLFQKMKELAAHLLSHLM